MSTEYSNPLPPENFDPGDHPTSNQEQPLTNADFRKFLATPSQSASKPQKESKTKRGFEKPREYAGDTESAAEKRKKKKSLYAKLKKQELERAAELAEKYRDRAKERREGKGDYTEAELLSTTANYKTVGPTTEIDKSAAEKRKRRIQESKFLGGDMKHTHLVKGLDFALLQKVRAEITNKEKEEEDLDEVMMDIDEKEIIEKPKEVPLQFKTKLAKRIHQSVQPRELALRNENFLPGRMAYVFTLYDEYAEADDIPTTLMRSKADCPTVESQITLTTNDIVINKLTQILLYLRQGSRDKHKKRKDKKSRHEREERVEPVKHRDRENDVSIYDDIGEYKPSMKRSSHSHRKSSSSTTTKTSYFGRSNHHDDDKYESKKEIVNSVKTFVKNVSEKNKHDEPKPKQKSSKTKGNPLVGSESTMPDSYAECYPSTQYDVSGMADSDDEADFSKMDQGNKKGPVGRWDFDTQEEYSSYMSQKEAMPKAAFQYGIKMAGGRKTRRTKEQTEKQKLNREWQQINQIMEKRKGSSTDKSTSEYKKPKY